MWWLKALTDLILADNTKGALELLSQIKPHEFSDFSINNRDHRLYTTSLPEIQTAISKKLAEAKETVRSLESKTPSVDSEGDVKMAAIETALPSEKKIKNLEPALKNILTQFGLNPNLDINTPQRLPDFFQSFFTADEIKENNHLNVLPLNVLIIAYIDWLVKKKQKQSSLFFESTQSQKDIFDLILKLIQHGSDLTQIKISNKTLIGLPSQLILQDEKPIFENMQYSPMIMVNVIIRQLEENLQLNDYLWRYLSAFPLPTAFELFSDAPITALEAYLIAKNTTKNNLELDRLLEHPGNSVLSPLSYNPQRLIRNKIDFQILRSLLQENGYILTGQKILEIVQEIIKMYSDLADADVMLLVETLMSAHEITEIDTLISEATFFVHLYTYPKECHPIGTLFLNVFYEKALSEMYQQFSNKKDKNLEEKLMACIQDLKNRVIQVEDKAQEKFIVAKELAIQAFDKTFNSTLVKNVLLFREAKTISDLPPFASHALKEVKFDEKQSLISSLDPSKPSPLSFLCDLKSTPLQPSFYERMNCSRYIAIPLLLNETVREHEKKQAQAVTTAIQSNHVGALSLLHRLLNYDYQESHMATVMSAPEALRSKKLVALVRHAKIEERTERDRLLKALGKEIINHPNLLTAFSQCVIFTIPELMLEFVQWNDLGPEFPKEEELTEWNAEFLKFLNSKVFSKNVPEFRWHYERHWIHAAHVELKKAIHRFSTEVMPVIQQADSPTLLDIAMSFVQVPMLSWWTIKHQSTSEKTAERKKEKNIIDKFLNAKTSNLNKKQQGFNCFDIAVNCERQEFVKFALEESGKPKVTALLAPEIRHALAISLAQPKLSEIALEQINYEFAQFRLEKNAEKQRRHAVKILKLLNPKMKISEREFLPEFMCTHSARILYANYEAAHENMRTTVIQCNDLLELKGEKRLAIESLDKFFLLEENRLKHPFVFELFTTARNRHFTRYEDKLNEFCSSEETYRNYITYYYGGKNWVAFQPLANDTCVINIYALKLAANIVVYDENNTEIFRTNNSTAKKEIFVRYKNQHFTAMKAAPMELEDPLVIEQNTKKLEEKPIPAPKRKAEEAMGEFKPKEQPPLKKTKSEPAQASQITGHFFSFFDANTSSQGESFQLSPDALLALRSSPH